MTFVIIVLFNHPLFLFIYFGCSPLRYDIQMSQTIQEKLNRRLTEYPEFVSKYHGEMNPFVFFNGLIESFLDELKRISTMNV
jgi:hypothetical protein